MDRFAFSGTWLTSGDKVQAQSCPESDPKLTQNKQWCFSSVILAVLTSEINVCFHVGVHFCEDFLEVIADGCQNSSVGQVGSPVCAQGNVTEQPRLPLTPQLAQHVSAVWRHRLCDASSGTQLLRGKDGKTEADKEASLQEYNVRKHQSVRAELSENESEEVWIKMCEEQKSEALMKTKRGWKLDGSVTESDLRVTCQPVTPACSYLCFLDALALALWTSQDKISDLEIHPCEEVMQTSDYKGKQDQAMMNIHH